MRAAAVALSVLVASAAAQAQQLSVAGTVRASVPDATRELARRRDAVLQCVSRAAREDPEGLASLRRIYVTLNVSRAGRATTVVLAPALLSPGLSECLADALLPWDQGGRPGMRALVRLRLDR
ncbi:MAG: hypothetical protein R3A48_26900 [Polyangiales bacterium]